MALNIPCTCNRFRQNRLVTPIYVKGRLMKGSTKWVIISEEKNLKVSGVAMNLRHLNCDLDLRRIFD